MFFSFVRLAAYEKYGGKWKQSTIDGEEGVSKRKVEKRLV